MNSPGLKRPSDFDVKPHVSGGPVASTNGAIITVENNKRRCTSSFVQDYTNMISTQHPFESPSKTLTSVHDHISKFIQEEVNRVAGASKTTSESCIPTSPTPTTTTTTTTAPPPPPPTSTSPKCNGNGNNQDDDIPIFSIRQTHQICERLVKEIEHKLRQEYEQKFTNTLAQTTTNIAFNLQQQAATSALLHVQSQNLQQQQQQQQKQHHHNLQPKPHPLLPQSLCGGPNQITSPIQNSSAVVPTSVPMNAAMVGPVLLVSNIDEQLATPENLFTLFGVFGDVVRVKILFNKKDNALIQMADSHQAQMALGYLDKQKIFGKPIRVARSKHQLVQMPREGNQSDAGLTKDFTNSPLHRYKFPGSRNHLNIYPPSPTLHISNIPPTIEENDIMKAFEKACQFRAASFKFFPKDRKMAIMRFDSIEQATIALIRLHNYQISEGFNLRVSYSKSTMQQ